MSTTDSSPNGDEDVYAVQANITKQQSLIKQMKKDNTPADVLSAEVSKLLAFRARLAELERDGEDSYQFNRKAFDELILRKMYVVPSFEIHNGPAGLFDYGPPACTLKANVINSWRNHFVVEENMLEMECTNLTPSSVLETSGHVERFTDFMVRDEITGECFRADKLLEDSIDNFIASHPEITVQEKEEHRIIQRQADAFDATALDAMLKKYNVKSPSNGVNELTFPFPFNLMFKTTIGPEGTSVGYLRPETAQGLFVNFRRLLDYNQQKMPFAAAQIGLGFRNEIAPRNGLLRVREFCMAEIEHFVHPDNKTHHKFNNIANVVLNLFPQDLQLTTGKTVQLTARTAVENGVINNQTLAYFMARTQQWLEKIGVDPKRMRFRQHLKTEMAHYAADCWDMEVRMSYGWIECVGHADRACYDLEQHSKRCNVPMVASLRLSEPQVVERTVVEVNRKNIGPRFKGDQKVVVALLEGLDADQVQALKSELEANGSGKVGDFAITPDLVDFKFEKKTVHEVKYTPSVIEPSYGVGRILYAVLEHAFTQREGSEQRCVMNFKAGVAPIKVGIFRLLNNEEFTPVINSIGAMLQAANIVYKIDSSSGSVGRRYSRADEIGIPFGITVDFQTLIDQTVTIRERTSMLQIRVSISQFISTLTSLISENTSWSKVLEKNPLFLFHDEEDDAQVTDALATTTPAAVKIQRTPRASFSRPNV